MMQYKHPVEEMLEHGAVVEGADFERVLRDKRTMYVAKKIVESEFDDIKKRLSQINQKLERPSIAIIDDESNQKRPVIQDLSAMTENRKKILIAGSCIAQGIAVGIERGEKMKSQEILDCEDKVIKELSD